MLWFCPCHHRRIYSNTSKACAFYPQILSLFTVQKKQGRGGERTAVEAPRSSVPDPELNADWMPQGWLPLAAFLSRLWGKISPGYCVIITGQIQSAHTGRRRRRSWHWRLHNWQRNRKWLREGHVLPWPDPVLGSAGISGTSSLWGPLCPLWHTPKTSRGVSPA